MQRLEVSGAVRLIYRSLGVKGLMSRRDWRENGSEEMQRKNNFNGKENGRKNKGK